MPMSMTDDLVELSKYIDLKPLCSLHVPFKTSQAAKNTEPETTIVSRSLAHCNQGAWNFTILICDHKDSVFQRCWLSKDMKI